MISSVSNPVDVRYVAAEQGCLPCGERMVDKCFLDEDDMWEVAVYISLECSEFFPICNTAGIPQDDMKLHLFIELCCL